MADTFAALPRSFAALEFVDVVAGASMHGVGPCICLMVMPVRDELRLLVLYAEPLLEDTLVEATAEALRSNLLET